MTEEAPRYASLGDYTRVLRRRRLLIALFALAGFVIALGGSLVQSNVYTAETQVQVRDPLSDLNLIGITSEAIPELAPNQRSAASAELITGQEASRRVARELDTSITPGGLRAAIGTRVNPQTNLVVIDASWGDAQFAADLANAYAEVAKDLGVDEFERRLAIAEDALRQQIRANREDLPEAGAGFRIAVLEQNLTQIRALTAVAEPVRLVQRAEVPGSPSSPQPVRNSILGLVFGLILGLIVAFVRDALDRRLHNAQEVHDELDMPVVGRIGEGAFAYPGLARGKRTPMLETEFEAFRVLRMNLAFLGENGKQAPRTVLVTSPLAGEGKTTVSMALASAAGLAGQRVLLVECDLRRPRLSERLEITRTPGLADYLMGDAAPGEVLQVVHLSNPTPLNGATRGTTGAREQSEESIVCITAGSPTPKGPELLQSPRFSAFLEKVRRAYDLVVLDASPLLAVADPLELVPHVDGVLICVRSQQTTREQARAARAALGHVPARPAGAVLTGLRPGDESYGYYYGY